MSEDVARAFGVVQLKPLECCNGRCQCSPGQCKCDSDCCGCCTECNCDHDGDAVMADVVAPPGEKPAVTAGCCGSGAPATPARGSQQLQVASSSGTVSIASTPINLSPTTALPGARLPSPGTSTPPNGPSGPSVRRNSSVSRAKEANLGATSGGRRLSTSSVSSQASVHRSTSTSSKPTSKSFSISTPHHNINTHHRPILPKPVSTGPGSVPRLVPPRAHSGSSRQPSPVHRSRASSQASSLGSPALVPLPLPLPHAASDFTIPPPDERGTNMPNQPPEPRVTDRFGDMTIGVDDIASALAASDVDFMTYMNQLLSTTDGEQSISNPAFDVGQGAVAPDPNLLSAFSGPTPRGAELEPSLGDIQELIAGALAQQGVLGNQSKAPEPPTTQATHEFNYFFNLPTSVHAEIIPSREEQMDDYQMSAGGSNLTMPQFAAGGVDPLQFDGNFFFTEYASDLSLQVPSIQPHPQTDSRRASSNGDLVVPQAPSIPAVSPAPPPLPQATVNGPDIIDLSKPLNSGDIDRIMQALLNQQARQAAAGPSSVVPTPSLSQQQQQQQQLPRSHPGSVSDPSDPFQQYIIDPADGTNPTAHLQQPPPPQNANVLPEYPDREWMHKAWMPNVLGQSSVQPE